VARRSKLEEARLAVSRQAADLFWKHGVDGTTGDAIAAASGLSTRTVWRYFRSKEACVEPLLRETNHRFVELLKDWPRDASIETYLQQEMPSYLRTGQEIADAVAAVRIITMIRKEPAIRTAWLMACAEAEDAFAGIIARRLGRSPEDHDVLLCAAATMAAVRVVDETVSTAAVLHGQRFELAEVVDMLTRAIRTASTLPICDPVI
jgi:AcrR family transcriptional regulator